MYALLTQLNTWFSGIPGILGNCLFHKDSTVCKTALIIQEDNRNGSNKKPQYFPEIKVKKKYKITKFKIREEASFINN